MAKMVVAVKGGAGSGNWGHAGRPGMIGGSGGRGGGVVSTRMQLPSMARVVPGSDDEVFRFLSGPQPRGTSTDTATMIKLVTDKFAVDEGEAKRLVDEWSRGGTV